MLKNRSIFSLIAHTLATVGGAWFAVIFISTSGGIFDSGTDGANAGAGIFSLILWILGLLLYVLAFAPFIGLFLGWISFFAKKPELTLIASIAYLVLGFFATGDSQGVLGPAVTVTFVAGILGIAGFFQERKFRNV